MKYSSSGRHGNAMIRTIAAPMQQQLLEVIFGEIHGKNSAMGCLIYQSLVAILGTLGWALLSSGTYLTTVLIVATSAARTGMRATNLPLNTLTTNSLSKAPLFNT